MILQIPALDIQHNAVRHGKKLRILLKIQGSVAVDKGSKTGSPCQDKKLFKKIRIKGTFPA